jgi:hypothetical protein
MELRVRWILSFLLIEAVSVCCFHALARCLRRSCPSIVGPSAERTPHHSPLSALRVGVSHARPRRFEGTSSRDFRCGCCFLLAVEGRLRPDRLHVRPSTEGVGSCSLAQENKALEIYRGSRHTPQVLLQHSNTGITVVHAHPGAPNRCHQRSWLLFVCLTSARLSNSDVAGLFVVLRNVFPQQLVAVDVSGLHVRSCFPFFVLSCLAAWRQIKRERRVGPANQSVYHHSKGCEVS